MDSCVGDSIAIEFRVKLLCILPEPLNDTVSSRAWLVADSCPGILIICDSLLGSDERDWAIISIWLELVFRGSDCGRTFAVGLVTDGLVRGVSFDVAVVNVNCCRSKYD